MASGTHTESAIITPDAGLDRQDSNTDGGGGLNRTITLPWLVFYGVGVTVGAGIFALVGEIVGIAGRNAPLSFMTAGAIAAVTALCYTRLIALYPKAGGEAVYANRGLGAWAGRLAGLGVVATGTISSAAIAVAFAGYLRELVAVPAVLISVGLVVVLAAVAARGVRESVVLAAAITALEVGTLAVVIAFGLPLLGDIDAVVSAFTPDLSDSALGWSPILAGAVVAFFAFVGFEDIANMAEETVDAKRTGPLAIIITLVVTITLYVLISTVAALIPNQAEFAVSEAPMATLFTELSGRDGRIVSVIAVTAMLNGVLVQIVMAARMLFGMAGEGLAPSALAAVHPVRQTPVRATMLVAGVIVVLAAFFPLVLLARATSLVILTVFTLVDLSLFMLGSREHRATVGRWRWVGLLGAAMAASLAVWEVVNW